MNMDVLAILMVAFGLFAILLFILFYIYARNARNKKRENEDYQDDMDKYKNIDKDSDNLVDEDIEKKDIEELKLETDGMEDFKDDGSLIKEVVPIVPISEKIDNSNSIEEETEEFVPKKKKM